MHYHQAHGLTNLCNLMVLQNQASATGPVDCPASTPTKARVLSAVPGVLRGTNLSRSAAAVARYQLHSLQELNWASCSSQRTAAVRDIFISYLLSRCPPWPTTVTVSSVRKVRIRLKHR